MPGGMGFGGWPFWRKPPREKVPWRIYLVPFGVVIGTYLLMIIIFYVCEWFQ